jgi:hypothetical protein
MEQEVACHFEVRKTEKRVKVTQNKNLWVEKYK